MAKWYALNGYIFGLSTHQFANRNRTLQWIAQENKWKQPFEKLKNRKPLCKA